MLQFKLDISRRVVSCNPIKISTEIAAKESYISDPNATFELDYTSLASGNSVSELELNYHSNGTIKSINIESDDKSSEVIKNSFSLIKGIALASAGVPALAGVQPVQTETCNVQIKSAIQMLENSKSAFISKTKAVSNASSEVERLTLVLATVDKPSELLLSQFKIANQNLKSLTNELNTLSKARLPYIALTTSKEEINWPKTGDPIESNYTHKPSLNLKKRWFTDSVSTAEANKLLNLFMLIEPLSDNIKSTKKPAQGRGIFYRIPIDASFKICMINTCGSDNSLKLKEYKTNIPQLGPQALLPFENKAFQNNHLQAEFSELGVPTKISFKSKKSSIEGITASLGEIGAELPAIRQQLLNEKIFELERTAKELEQQKLIDDARKSLLPPDPDKPSPTAELEANETMIQAQTDLILAEIALKEAEIRLSELLAE